jgi:hypothetical protein
MLAGSTVASPSSSAAPRSRLTACGRRVNSRACARCSASASSRGVRSRLLPALLRLALLAGALLPAGAQLLDGARDGGLDQLAVDAAVEDHPRAVELEQHAGGARLVELGLSDPDRRRPVGVGARPPGAAWRGFP